MERTSRLNKYHKTYLVVNRWLRKWRCNAKYGYVNRYNFAIKVFLLGIKKLSHANLSQKQNLGKCIRLFVAGFWSLSKVKHEIKRISGFLRMTISGVQDRVYWSGTALLQHLQHHPTWRRRIRRPLHELYSCKTTSCLWCSHLKEVSLFLLESEKKKRIFDETNIHPMLNDNSDCFIV